jgi:hypothetical protein
LDTFGLEWFQFTKLGFSELRALVCRTRAHRQPGIAPDDELYDRGQDEISLDEIERIAI